MSLCVQKGIPHSPLNTVKFVPLHIIVADQANLTNTVACDHGYCHGSGLGYWVTNLIIGGVRCSISL